MKPSRQSGLTLVELICVIILLAVASIPILGRFTQASVSALINEDIQTASQLAQERAEDILSRRRNQGFNAVSAGTIIDTLPFTYSNYIRTVAVTNVDITGGCPSATNCKEVAVTVSRSSRIRAEISFMLVDY